MTRYLEIQILILGAVTLLVIARRLFPSGGPRFFLRLAQSLAILALLLPPAFSLLPRRGFEAMPVHALYREVDSIHWRAPRTRAKAPAPPVTPPALVTPAPREFPWGACLLALWALGALALLARFARDAIALRRLVRGGELLRKVGRVRVLASATLGVPLSFRAPGAAWVVLPYSLLERARDRRVAILHELEHHRQGDTWWALFEEAMHCFLYPNPAFRALRRRIREEQEFSCDEALVGRHKVSAQDYGSCLVRVAEAALAGRDLYTGTAYMAWAGGNPDKQRSFLRRRIEMIMEKKNASRRSKRLLVGTVLLLSLGAAAGAAEEWARGPEVNPGTPRFDPRVQEIADRILGEEVSSQHAKSGFAIVADPQAGRILAVANVDRDGHGTGAWALAKRVTPASVFKSLIAAEAIDENKAKPGTEFFCENGHYTYRGRVFHDWKAEGFDHLSTARTIMHSSDLCAIKLAETLGESGIEAMLRKFGFGPGGTAGEFPGARPGTLPVKDRYYVPYAAFGQNMEITPLEIVQAYGAIANGGELLMPIGAAEPGRKVLRRVLSREAAASMREILEGVVLSGTAREHGASASYTTAGKTGTGYSMPLDRAFWDDGVPTPNMGSFVGFAPAKNPRVEVYVGIVDPRTSSHGGAHGSEHAVPVFRRIAEAVLQEWGVAPDKP